MTTIHSTIHWTALAAALLFSLAALSGCGPELGTTDQAAEPGLVRALSGAVLEPVGSGAGLGDGVDCRALAAYLADSRFDFVIVPHLTFRQLSDIRQELINIEFEAATRVPDVLSIFSDDVDSAIGTRSRHARGAGIRELSAGVCSLLVPFEGKVMVCATAEGLDGSEAVFPGAAYVMAGESDLASPDAALVPTKAERIAGIDVTSVDLMLVPR